MFEKKNSTDELIKKKNGTLETNKFNFEDKGILLTTKLK